MDDFWGEEGAEKKSDQQSPSGRASTNESSPVGAANLVAGKSLDERKQQLIDAGRDQVEAQRREIEERTRKLDDDSTTKDKVHRKAATEYNNTLRQTRENKIRNIQEKHHKEQDELEEKKQELRQTGALWPGVNLLVDVKKPNTLNQGSTERMGRLFQRLQETGGPVKPQ